ncbi:MAG TPA: TadE family protein [Gaiellaceae bacterium]|nr:TadE family protein [Gaiellaceae bacterium]
MRNRISLRNQRGQSVVEFALVLPALMLILLAIVQFGVVFKQYITLTDAVREGARKAAVSRHRPAPSDYVKAEVVKAGSDLGSDFDTGDVTVSSSWDPGEDVTVHAKFEFSIDVLGRVVKSGTMTSTAVERVE